VAQEVLMNEANRPRLYRSAERGRGSGKRAKDGRQAGRGRAEPGVGAGTKPSTAGIRVMVGLQRALIFDVD
jgi:hypothetical protein